MKSEEELFFMEKKSERSSSKKPTTKHPRKLTNRASAFELGVVSLRAHDPCRELASAAGRVVEVGRHTSPAGRPPRVDVEWTLRGS